MSRPIDPIARYRIRPHVTNGYTYASTQPAIVDPLTRDRSYRRMHWGVVDADKKFHPNNRFTALPVAEQAKMIFPTDWDLSALDEIEGYTEALEALEALEEEVDD